MTDRIPIISFFPPPRNSYITIPHFGWCVLSKITGLIIMSGYSIHLVQNNSTIYILVHLPLLACPCSLSSLCSLASVPAWQCKFAGDNSGRTMPTSGVVAAAVAVTACYPAGVMAAWLPLLFPHLTQFCFVLPAHFHRPSFTDSLPLSQFLPFCILLLAPPPLPLASPSLPFSQSLQQ